MLNGLYGYLFGEESNDSSASVSSLDEPSLATSSLDAHVPNIEEDWFLVEDAASGRSSPVLVPNYDVRDIDELSLASLKATAPPTIDAIRKAEKLRQAKAKNAQRLQLERALFDDETATTSGGFERKDSTKSGKQLVAGGVGKDTKAKGSGNRSKKASGKLSSGRSNDRKVNNIE